MSVAAIQILGLTKSFGAGVVALNGLNLSIPHGAVYGLVGRNGAGKTTTLRLLLGMLRADQGTARLLDQDWWEAPLATRERIAYVPQTAQQPGWMTYADLCRCAARFHRRWNHGLARYLARRWGIPENRPVRVLSGGLQRLASLAVALSSTPDVLLLDEPGAGLDPAARRDLLECLSEFLGQRPGTTLLLSTHLLGDLERIATHVGILDKGQLLTEGRLDDWAQTLRRVQVVFPGDCVPEHFEIPGSLRSNRLGPVYTGVVKLIDPSQLTLTARWPAARIQTFPMSLEDLFLALFPPGPPVDDIRWDDPWHTTTGADPIPFPQPPPRTPRAGMNAPHR